jgi:hypothetical protein
MVMAQRTPIPGMKIGQILLPTADCPLPTIFHDNSSSALSLIYEPKDPFTAHEQRVREQQKPGSLPV